MTHRAICRLPKKPSALILLALNDLAKAERTKGYEINMGDWHVAADTAPRYDPETCKVTAPDDDCYVCLAGSVMAFSLNVPRSVELTPGDFSTDVQNALYAVNDFRVGDVGAALRRIGIAEAKVNKAAVLFGKAATPYFDTTKQKTILRVAGDVWVRVADYDDHPANRTKFKKQMREMAKKLASIGL